MLRDDGGGVDAGESGLDGVIVGPGYDITLTNSIVQGNEADDEAVASTPTSPSEHPGTCDKHGDFIEGEHERAVMSSQDVPPRNRAERRLAARNAPRAKRARAAGAALTAGSAALAMGAAWIGTGVQAAGAATTLHVTSTADSGAGTLRDQVTAASSGDTIVFDLTGTITLTSGEIAFNKDLTFTGPGASALTISGNDASRVFDITGGSAVTISGLTIAHGSDAGSGGAIVTAGPLTLSDDVFDHNSSGDDGGAVDVDGAGITVTNSTFTNNETDDWGGAILAFGGNAPVTVTGSTFSANHAGDTGGAVAVEAESTVSFVGSSFGNNLASHAGAIGIYNDGPVSVSGSTLTGNTADGTNNQREGIGGAFDAYDAGSVSFEGSTISGNTSAEDGGGASVYEIEGAVSIVGSSITGNTADGSGGGAFTDYLNGGLQIANSTISGNSTSGWGGGLYSGYTYQFLTISQSTISQNSAGSGGGGAQIWGAEIDAPVMVTDSTISGNSAESGGGGWIQWGAGGLTTFANSTISGNTSGGQGGGLYFYGFYGLSVEMSTVTGNSAADSTGGVYLAQSQLQSAAGGGHHAHEAGAASSGGAGSKGDGVREHKTHEAQVHAADIAEAEITGTILWGNSGNDLGDVGAATLSHNLLGTVAAGIAQTDGGGNLFGVDPLLGPLDDNGGPTETHALLPGSPAIDKGPDPVPSFSGNEFDQRGDGFPRVVNGISDIGAFEVQPPPTPEPVVITPKFTG